jgi:S-formylglutathione hydrolase FrmB
MKFSGKGLKPAQLTVIYFLAAVFILIHQVDGLAGWLEDIARSGESRFHVLALNLADDLRSKSEQSGLTKISQGETKIINAITPKWEIGRLTASKDRKSSEPERQVQNNPPGNSTNSSTIKYTHSSATSSRSTTANSSNNSANNQATLIYLSTAEKPRLETVPNQDNSNSVNPPPLSETASNPPTIYDTDLQSIALPLKPVESINFKNPKPIKKVLMTGDSMMVEGIGPPLERYFKSIEDLEVSRKGRYSTGLCRLDYFDWFTYFEELLVENQPDLVVITLGANDTQDIVVEGRKRHLVTSPGWNEIYSQRVKQIITLAAEHEAQILWLGLPIMGREPYNTRVKNINEVTQEACQKEDNCLFWDASLSLTDKNGKYSAFITVEDGRHVKVRAKDSIHLTEEGGKQMLADLLTDSPFLAADMLKNPLDYAPAAGLATKVAENVVQNLAAPTEILQIEAAQNSPAQKDAVQIKVTINDSQTLATQAGEPINENSALVPTFSTPNLAQVQTQQPKSTELPAVGPAGEFILTETTLSSTYRGQTKYLAVVPKNTTQSLLPAVLLLHGAEGDHNFFVNGLGDELLELATRYGIIFIMPNGGPFGWYLDSPLKAESQIATFIISELLPDTLSRFPIDPNRLAVLGISMGGHGAITLALNNPGRFKAISIVSAVIDLESHKSNSSLDRYLRLHEILGPSELAQDVWRNHSAYFITRRRSEALSEVPISMSVGLGDKLCLAENRQYDRLLTELGIKHQYVELSGGHDWSLWKAQFPGQLAFLANYL